MSAQLFVNATVFTPDPVAGIDVLVSGAVITAIGPGLRAVGATSVDCTGRMIAPLFAGPVAVGGPATFAIVPFGELETIVLWPSRNLTLVSGGTVVPAVDTAPGPSTSPHLGTWIDATGFIHQHLTADGRYDETRGGRRHAYRGAFRIDGDRIVYRDDLGFWAYGRFDGGVLHHGGYTFTRKDS
ncbi:Atu4866 domain-containing protein [Catenuloplanes japonicus]|uniref:Atu4866 domain-containing protein n=1 Tax=Catenuloplanes japonicus TaxID=33876 RepID=UPI000689C0AA|nr:Atu4866 domain-containing protein [Catenuloplanes japonicus]